MKHLSQWRLPKGPLISFLGLTLFTFAGCSQNVVPGSPQSAATPTSGTRETPTAGSSFSEPTHQVAGEFGVLPSQLSDEQADNLAKLLGSQYTADEVKKMSWDQVVAAAYANNATREQLLIAISAVRPTPAPTQPPTRIP